MSANIQLWLFIINVSNLYINKCFGCAYITKVCNFFVSPFKYYFNDLQFRNTIPPIINKDINSKTFIENQLFNVSEAMYWDISVAENNRTTITFSLTPTIRLFRISKANYELVVTRVPCRSYHNHYVYCHRYYLFS